MIIGHIILDTHDGSRSRPSRRYTQADVDKRNAEAGYERFRLVPIRRVVVVHLNPVPEA